MDSEGFRVFLLSEKVSERSVSNYVHNCAVINRDMERLTGRGLDEAGLEDIRKTFAGYARALRAY